MVAPIIARIKPKSSRAFGDLLKSISLVGFNLRTLHHSTQGTTKLRRIAICKPIGLDYDHLNGVQCYFTVDTMTTGQNNQPKAKHHYKGCRRN